ncbi:MAG TPA: hypothetical protein VGM07_03870 [Stellaceae bacterium]|jgi:hypothetical protein
MDAMIRPLTIALLLCAGTGLAAAQTPQGATPAAPGHGPAANSQTLPSAPGGAPGSLSKELNRSGGVIHPPATHDRGVVSPPSRGVGRTPVIPPPGTPGGNPNVQPK